MRLMDDPALNTVNTTAFRIVVGVRITVAVYVVMGTGWVYEVFWQDSRVMAESILDSALLALFGILGINAAQYAAKRFSDRDTKVQVAAAKASGPASQTVSAPGGTVIASAPPSTTTVNEQEDGGKTVTTGTPAPLMEPHEEQEWATGDPREGVL